MLPLVHVVLVEDLIHHDLLVLFLACRHRCDLVEEPKIYVINSIPAYFWVSLKLACANASKALFARS